MRAALALTASTGLAAGGLAVLAVTGGAAPALAASPASTTTSLASSANPSNPGQQVTYTATVGGKFTTAPADGGTVAFQDDGVVICAQPVNASTGTATCTVSYGDVSFGPHSITAVYTGDASFAGSSSAALTQTVTEPTTTSLASSANPSNPGQQVTYTAAVSPVPDGGTVNFQDGGADISGCAAVSVDTTTGRATCQITYGSAGSHAITATYSGHGNYQGSTSNTLTQQVNPADSDLGLTGMPANITTTATGPAGAVVTYTSPTATDDSGDTTAASVGCAPASGSTFPVGTTTVTCTATDSDDANSPVSQSFTVKVTPVLTVAAKNISPAEGKAFSGTVASGTDYGAGTLTATINWGDGNSSAGTVNLSSNGSYSVMGSHTYAEEGTYTVTVTVSASGGQSAASSSSAKVADAALTVGKVTATVSGLQVGVSAPFTDADPNGTAADYTATIAWGDGTTGPATIATSGRGFTARGAHTYKAHGTYSVTITITDTGGSSAKTKISIKV